MQPGSGYVNRGNNTHATLLGEPIEIDQASIRSVDISSVQTEDTFTSGESTAAAAATYDHPYHLHSHQMGQGASSPRDESQNLSSSNNTDQQLRRDGDDVEGAADQGTSADLARLRRSRRLRNHMDHLSRLGNRLMPVPAPTASDSTSSSSSSTVRNRAPGVPGLRFRSRSARFSGSRSRSRSPSPLHEGARNMSASQHRRRTMQPTTPPVHRSLDTPVVDLGPDMMDITPIPSLTPIAPALPAPLPSGVEPRRSRMSRVRDSISSWPTIPDISSIISRQSSRRPAEVPISSVLGDITPRNQSTTNMDLSGGPAEVPTESSEMPSMFGNGGLDGPQNPGRIRPGEDQAAMLSRLLSVAAAATAASLVGNAEEAITQAQDVGGDNGGDGSFEAFLRALQNGRLEAALRNGGNEMGGGTIPPDPNAEGGVLSLNFFRMFRFGSTPATARDREEHAQNSEEGAPEPGRMVPVIIVGIRSVPPRESTEGGEGNNRPGPFFDALANLPVSLPGSHRRNRPSGSTGGTHRRAASLGTPGSPSRVGTSPIPDHGINPFAGPHTDTPSGPNPPPTTPAEPAMPPFPTGVYRRNPMEPALVDPFEGDRPARQSLPRRLSNPDMLNPFGIPPGASGDGAARERNSTSGPRPAGQPTGPPEGTRSWIIYVLGGSYPENHPILTTPSLFTDEPTYEDMTLLSSLLGPAKLPVAAKEDIDSAGGIFTFGEGGVTQYGPGNDDRCLICLSDYETGAECRKLIKCNHIFHQECIDEWLTTGRNSCPLCRGEGVEEKAKAPTAPTGEETVAQELASVAETREAAAAP